MNIGCEEGSKRPASLPKAIGSAALGSLGLTTIKVPVQPKDDAPYLRASRDSFVWATAPAADQVSGAWYEDGTWSRVEPVPKITNSETGRDGRGSLLSAREGC
jgi:hypothetical protein